MRSIVTLILLLPCLFISQILPAQATPVVGTLTRDGIQFNGLEATTYRYAYRVPNDPAVCEFQFALTGGSGASARAGMSDCTAVGGEGATVNATFTVGTGVNDLQPGATLAFIIGQRGYSHGWTDFVKGGSGGSSSAVLYTESSDINSISGSPTTDWSLRATRWVILGVAGGGGGAYSEGFLGGSTVCRDGLGAESGTSGGADGGGNYDGGTNGQGGESAPGQFGATIPGGGGAFGDAEEYGLNNNDFWLGQAGYAYGVRRTYTIFGTTKTAAGFSTGGIITNHATGGGGGGGYSGGGGGTLVFPGGGGGSYLHPNGNGTITAGRDGHDAGSGEINYFFGDADNPTMTCPTPLKVYVQRGGDFDWDATILNYSDNCSSYAEATFEVALQGTGGNFTTLTSPSCNYAGTTGTLRVTATDQAGNTTSCTGAGEIVDRTPTVSCPTAPRSILYIDADREYDWDRFFTDYYDDCLTLDEINIDVREGFIATDYNRACDLIGTDRNTLQITLTDNSGNTATCRVNVDVLGDIGPRLDCGFLAPHDVYLDYDGTLDVTGLTSQLGITDRCFGNSNAPYTAEVYQTGTTVAPDFCSVLSRTVSVDAEVTDVNGVSNRCNTQITFIPRGSLTLDCVPTATVTLDASGNGTLGGDQIVTVDAARACLIGDYGTNLSFDCFDIGTEDYRVTVQTAWGSSVSTTCAVTVVDHGGGNCDATPPPHDDLANAIEFTLSTTGFTHVTDGYAFQFARSEANEEICDNMIRSVWYKTTPTSNVGMLLSTEETDVNPFNGTNSSLAVYTGTGTHALAQVVCQDADDYEERGESVFLNLTAGTTYYVRVGVVRDDARHKSILFSAEERSTLVTWSGAVSDDWATPGNWTTGTVPVEGQTANIPQGASNLPVIHAGTIAEAGRVYISTRLTVEQGATLNLPAGNSGILGPNFGTIIIEGDVNITDGTAEGMYFAEGSIIIRATGRVTISGEHTWGIRTTGRLFLDGELTIDGAGTGIEHYNGRFSEINVDTLGVLTVSNVSGAAIESHDYLDNDGTVILEGGLIGIDSDNDPMVNYGQMTIRDFAEGIRGAQVILSRQSTLNIQNCSTAALASGTLNVESGSTLAASGTIDASTTFRAGATLLPGASPGCLIFTQPLDLSNVNVTLELDGSDACTQHDRITAPQLTLTGMNLTLLPNMRATAGEELVLFESTGTASITGEAAGMNDGFQVRIGADDYTLSYSGGDGNDVSIMAANVLPVELTAFTGRALEKINELTWSTATELDFSHFTVQRSADGSTWQDLGAVAGAGQTGTEQGYQYADPNPPLTAYYRLEMVDLDGSTQMSEVVILRREANTSSLTVFPNPNAGQFSVRLPLEEGETALLTCYDLTGKVVFRKNAGSLYRQTTALPSGIYLLVVELPSGRNAQRVVVR